MNSWNIKGHSLEYIDDTHTYLIDGVVVPSITQILKLKFGNKYDGVSKEVLNNAREKGTKLHKLIEDYCKEDIMVDDKELRNFIFLKKQYKFNVLDNEVPVILFLEDKPVCAGRLDLVLELDGKIGLADIKRTSVLDKEYLAYQLNLYRVAYQQCYDKNIEFLRGVHLREDVRKFAMIPINEEMAVGLLKEYLDNGD